MLITGGSTLPDGSTFQYNPKTISKWVSLCYGNYICIPNHDVGSELSGFRDLFWNTERLSGLIKKVDAVTVAHGLCHLEELIHPKNSVDN